MSAAKKFQQLPVDVQEMVINGGDSAGAQNGSRVAKPGPSITLNPVFSPEMARVEGSPSGRFSNKQDEKQGLEKEAQGKPEAIPGIPGGESAAADRAVITLPPAAPINLGGRPPALTPERVELLFQFIAIGLSRCQAAAHLGIDRSIITRAEKRDPELRAALERAEDLSELQPQLTIIAEARKNWRAALSWLEYKAKHRPARKKTAEEKEEQHQENLDWVRRVNEEFDAARRKP
jgi:hypothetical protein